MKVIISLLIIVLLHSCSCNWHIKKARNKCGVTTDTVFKELTVEVPKVETDTVFKEYFTQRDTVIIREGRLTMKYYYNTHDSTVYLSGKCDTVRIVKRVPVTVNKYKSRAINWNWLLTLGIIIGSILVYLLRKK